MLLKVSKISVYISTV